MKKLSVVALGSIAAAALMAGAIPAQAAEGGPTVPGIKLSFVPKTKITYTGKYCNNSKQTEKAAIALSGKQVVAFGKHHNIEVSVKAPGAGWGRGYIAFGPNYGSIGSPGLPKSTFDTHRVTKAGVYKVKVRSQQDIEIDPDGSPLTGGDTETIYGPWSAPMKITITKKQLKKVQSRTSKEPCYA